MAGGDEIVMVNNNHKSALQTARSAGQGAAYDLETALRAAQRAVEAGAWGGPMGEDFAGELARYRRMLSEAGPEAMTTFDAAVSAQPDRVESTAWQSAGTAAAPGEEVLR